MTHHWPGTTWHRPWSRPSGSVRGWVTGASTWPPVPSEMSTMPLASSSRARPRPSAAAGASAPPIATAIPAGRPSDRAASSRSSPAFVSDSASGGRSPASMPSFSQMSTAQVRVLRSSKSVAEASETSLATSPVRRARKASLGCTIHRVRAKTSGSLAATHMILGAVKLTFDRLPVRATSSARGIRFSISTASASARPSDHIRADRTGTPAASRKTALCIWPVSPRATTSAPRRFGRDSISDMASRTASHQRSGFCSA